MARLESQTALERRLAPVRQANRLAGRRVSAPAHTPETPVITVDSLDCQEGRRLRPQISQAIELPLVLGEDMDQHVSEVKHDPAAGGPTLDALGPNARLGHALSDGAIDGAQLTLVGPGRDHEVIGKGRELVDIEHNSIASGRITDDVRQQEGPLSASPSRRGPVGGPDIFQLWRHPLLLNKPRYRRVVVGPAGIEPATMGL